MTEQKPPWRPLSERVAGLTGDRALVDGTPPYLLGPLQTWLYNVAISAQHVETRERLELRLRRTGIFQDAPGKLIILVEGKELLEAIDATLSLHARLLDNKDHNLQATRTWWIVQVRDLELILHEGGSTWTTKDTFDGLTNRLDEAVAQVVRATIADAKSDASAHLRKAWDAAYRLDPDPTLAYSEAVKAVESISIPLVVPKQDRATMGHVLGELKKPGWEVAISNKDGNADSAHAVIHLIEMLWYGQRDRHAGPAMKLATVEAARMAVHAAATLVQWFTAGAIRKQP